MKMSKTQKTMDACSKAIDKARKKWIIGRTLEYIFGEFNLYKYLKEHGKLIPK